MSSIPNRSEDSEAAERKRQRLNRFKSEVPTPKIKRRKGDAFVGTLQSMEKSYLRLTSEPDPENVRPPNVLLDCLSYVVRKYRAGNLYQYVNDQLKAIRQDLTVQHIENDFSVEVYETHARIAIENNDMGEFNQCQTQLSHLYAKLGLSSIAFEFTCYRILYLLLTNNQAGIISLIPEISTNGNDDPFCWAVEKSLQLQVLKEQSDYHGFFNLYAQFRDSQKLALATQMIEQSLVPKQRLVALATMTKAYKKVPKTFIESELKFTPVDTWHSFMKQFGLERFVGDELDCIAARLAIVTIVEKPLFRKIDIKGQV